MACIEYNYFENIAFINIKYITVYEHMKSFIAKRCITIVEKKG
jgi:hypothetical protein